MCFVSQIYSQESSSCKIKEVTCYILSTSNTNSNEEFLLQNKLIYNNNSNLINIEYFNLVGELRSIKHFEYDSLGRCVLMYFEIDDKYLDTLQAFFDNRGNFIPIRVQTLNDLIFPESKFNKIKYNKCGNPVEIIKFQRPKKDYIISKYRYEYTYW